MSVSREESLEYHTRGRAGKIEVVSTKRCTTQRDLSMAYTPGVAEPCREIEKDPAEVYRYTAKGNLVAVVSNGTAVLGLGNIGALASGLLTDHPHHHLKAFFKVLLPVLLHGVLTEHQFCEDGIVFGKALS